MIYNPFSKIGWMVKVTIPLLITLALMLVILTNFQVRDFSKFPPLICLISLFYWMLYWPIVMSKWVTFFLAFFHDAVNGMPLGTMAIIMVFFWWILSKQRKHIITQPFIIIWLVFSISVAILCVAYWVMFMLLSWRTIGYEPMLMQAALTVILYPVMHQLFSIVHRILHYKPRSSKPILNSD